MVPTPTRARSGSSRAVLFDFFGTLTTAVRRTGRLRAQRRIARVLGCDPAAYLKALDGSYYQRAAGRLGQLPDALRTVARTAGADPTPEQVNAAVALRMRAQPARRLRPEAVGVLRELRRRSIGTAVVSDCTQELPAGWPSLPVARYIQVPVFSVEVGVCKPDPRIYARAYRPLGVPPTDCVYIGDGDSRELTGARSLGMTAVRLAAPDVTEDQHFNGDIGWDGPSVHSLRDVLDLVG